MKQKILIADDDKNICELLNLYLTNEGYELSFAHTGSDAINIATNDEFALILLDVMMPLINGWEVCKIIRQKSNIPIIFITAKDLVEDKVQGFELGANDYIVKPFEPKEVIARIKARLKDNSTSSVSHKANVYELDDIIVDLNSYKIMKNNVLVELTPKEIQLLVYFLINKNIVLTREILLKNVWDYDFVGDTRTVDVHVKKLREKLVTENSNWSFKTIWGVGYKLEG